MTAYIGAFAGSPVSIAAPKLHVYAPVSVPKIAGAAPVFYRLRAYDTTLATTVYWNSTALDTSEYTGPGPLTNLVLLD
jgi:hypothetical protein